MISVMVKCLVCDKELTYSNNTSSMLRHYRALHGHADPVDQPATSQDEIAEKAMLDNAMMNMVIKASRPLSVVEDVGFRELMQIVDPNYTLPSRKALKEIVDKKYKEAKEKAKLLVQKAVAVSLTCDMWTSINMDAYLAVTCHFKSEDKLCTTLLGVHHFPKAHTAENLWEGHIKLMQEWGIVDKVKCLITDGASEMLFCAKRLNIRHTICIAHTINLIVRKSFDDVDGLNDLRAKCRRLVTYFGTSTTAKKQLVHVQEQIGRQPLKMIVEVDTLWNSTFQMFQRVYDMREPVGAALVSLRTDITPLTAPEHDIIKDVLCILDPFQQATVELSAEKRVWASKVIPLMSMVHHAITTKTQNLTSNITKQLGDKILRRLRDHIHHLESVSVLTLPTLLDPRNLLLCVQQKEAVTKLKNECAVLMRNNASSVPLGPAETHPLDLSANSGGLWQLLDQSIPSSRSSSSVVADATIEVDR